MMPKKILVLSAAVGAGHMRAAQAVELAMRQVDSSATVRNVDVLTLASGAFRKVYGEAYLELVNKAPHALGYFYDMLDKPRRANSTRDRLRLAMEKLNLRKLDDLLSSEAWDAVVNTHFLPAEILANLKKRRRSKLRQMTVTTDFETHRLWVNQPCEQFTTATEEGRHYLEHWGVPIDSVRATGIPIHPVFANELSREAACGAQGLLCDGRPVVLQLAGGFGVGPVEQIYRGLLAIERPLQLVCVAGKNAAAKTKLAKIEVPPRHAAKVIGFTTEIDQLMAAADVVVSKPGGLTTSEVLARGAAMAIVNPIPGQESRNSDYLLENGAAIKINNLGTLAFKLGNLLSDEASLQRLRKNAKKLARPRAAFDVAEMALAL